MYSIKDALTDMHERNERKREAARARENRMINLSEYDESRGAWLWTYGVLAAILLAAVVVVINLIARAI